MVEKGRLGWIVDAQRPLLVAVVDDGMLGLVGQDDPSLVDAHDTALCQGTLEELLGLAHDRQLHGTRRLLIARHELVGGRGLICALEGAKGVCEGGDELEAVVCKGTEQLDGQQLAQGCSRLVDGLHRHVPLGVALELDPVDEEHKQHRQLPVAAVLERQWPHDRVVELQRGQLMPIQIGIDCRLDVVADRVDERVDDLGRTSIRQDLGLIVACSLGVEQRIVFASFRQILPKCRRHGRLPPPRMVRPTLAEGPGRRRCRCPVHCLCWPRVEKKQGVERRMSEEIPVNKNKK